MAIDITLQIDGVLRGVAEEYVACGWAVVQFHFDGGRELWFASYGMPAEQRAKNDSAKKRRKNCVGPKHTDADWWKLIWKKYTWCRMSSVTYTKSGG